MSDSQSGWQTNDDVFAAAATMIHDLRASRGMDSPLREIVTNDSSRIIADFCFRLRRSNRNLILPMLQRSHRLTAEGMTLVCYALCSYAGCPGIANDSAQAFMTAVGFSPPAMGRLMASVGRSQVGLLIVVDQGKIWPSPKLYALTYMPDLCDNDAAAMKKHLARLPTAPAARDVLYKGRKRCQ